MGVAPDSILPLLLLTSLQAETKKGTFFFSLSFKFLSFWALVDVSSNDFINLVHLGQAWIFRLGYVELWIVVKYLSLFVGFWFFFHLWVELVYFDPSNLEMYFFLSSPVQFFILSKPINAVSNVFDDFYFAWIHHSSASWIVVCVSCLRFYVGIIIDARGRLRIGLMSDNQEERRLLLVYLCL